MPGIIPASQASPLYTTALRAKFDEMQSIKVNNFFRSFFKDEICKERYPVIDVRRGSEKVAVDVMRGHQGQRTQITKSTQKAFDPFYFKLYFDATELQGYFRVFGSDSFNLNEMSSLVNEMALHNKSNQDMIDRAIEIFCASVLETGTCTSLRDGTVVNFNRKAASMINVNTVYGSYWSDSSHDIITDLKNSGDFLRQVGKSSGYVLNVICGTDAWAALRNNTAMQERWKEFNNHRDMLMPAQLESTGAVYQGQIDCNSYMCRFWTYNDFYEATNGTLTPYMNPKKVYVLPENPEFSLLYAATPQIVQPGAGTSSLVAAKYVLNRYVNPEEGYDRSYIECSPLPVPKSVDRIYTMTVLA